MEIALKFSERHEGGMEIALEFSERYEEGVTGSGLSRIPPQRRQSGSRKSFVNRNRSLEHWVGDCPWHVEGNVGISISRTPSWFRI